MQVEGKVSKAKLNTLFKFLDSQSLIVHKQLKENQGKQMILRNQYEDLLCEQKYHDDAMKLVTQKLQKMDNDYKKSPTMRRLKNKGKQIYEKRQSQFMAIRQNDVNVITSNMENLHIDTQTETID